MFHHNLEVTWIVLLQGPWLNFFNRFYIGFFSSISTKRIRVAQWLLQTHFLYSIWRPIRFRLASFSICPFDWLAGNQHLLYIFVSFNCFLTTNIVNDTKAVCKMSMKHSCFVKFCSSCMIKTKQVGSIMKNTNNYSKLIDKIFWARNTRWRIFT